MKSITFILLRTIGAFSQLLVTVILARLMPVAEYGQFVYFVSFVLFLAIPVNVGVSAYAVREIAGLDGPSQGSHSISLERWLNLYNLKVAGALAFFLYLSSVLFDTFSLGSRVFDIPFLILTVLFLGLSSIYSGLLRGLGNMIEGSSPEFLVRPLVLIALSYLYYYFNKSLSANSTAIIYVSALIFSTVISYSIWRKMFFSNKNKPSPNIWSYKVLLNMTVYSGGLVFLSNFDIVVLGFVAEARDVGIYKVLLLLSGIMLLPQTIINQYIQPEIAKSFKSRDFRSIYVTLRWWGAVISSVAIITGVIICLYYKEIILFSFGDGYIPTIESLYMMVLASIVNAMFGSAGMVLMMSGAEGYAKKSLIVGVVVNIVLSSLLIPSYGVSGAALSFAATTLVWNSLMRNYSKKALGIETSAVVLIFKRGWQ